MNLVGNCKLKIHFLQYHRIDCPYSRFCPYPLKIYNKKDSFLRRTAACSRLEHLNLLSSGILYNLKICLVILEHNIDSLDKFCIFCRDIEILCNARNLDIYIINILYIILIHIVHRKNPQNSKTIHSSKNSHFYKFYEKVKFLETGRALDLIFLSFIWSGISSKF